MKLYESKEYDIQELYQRKEVSFSNNIEIFQILRKQVEDIVRYDHLSIYGMNPISLVHPPKIQAVRRIRLQRVTYDRMISIIYERRLLLYSLRPLVEQEQINNQITIQEEELQSLKKKFEESQTSMTALHSSYVIDWEELLEKKASLKNQLLELIKEKQNLLVCPLSSSSSSQL